MINNALTIGIGVNRSITAHYTLMHFHNLVLYNIIIKNNVKIINLKVLPARPIGQVGY